MSDVLELQPAYTNSFTVSVDPLVAYIDDVVSPEECEAIIQAASPTIERSKVSNEAEGEFSKGRTGSNTWVKHDHNDITETVCERIANIVGIPLEHAESMQVIHYGVTQEYRSHYDAYDLSTLKGQRCCKNGGQRMLTALVYLNDIEEGGGTGFPKCDALVNAKKGRLVIFHNCENGTTDVHKKSLHAGTPVKKGEKWAFNLWFRNRPTSEIQKF